LNSGTAMTVAALQDHDQGDVGAVCGDVFGFGAHRVSPVADRAVAP